MHLYIYIYSIKNIPFRLTAGCLLLYVQLHIKNILILILEKGFHQSSIKVYKISLIFMANLVYKGHYALEKLF